MTHGYSENELVELPAFQLFQLINWKGVDASDEVIGLSGTLGRETKGDAVLRGRLQAALERLNPGIPPEGIIAAIDEISRDRSVMALATANREVWQLLRNGVPVSVSDRKRGGQKAERVRVISWERPDANDFLVARQFSLTGSLYTRRPDLVGFVNGLPLVVIEFKKPAMPVRAAFDDNLTTYKTDVPQLFWYNALLIASNGPETRIGSLTALWEHFGEWKRIDREDEPSAVSLEKAIRGTCEPSRLLDLTENFSLFSEEKVGLVKLVAKNHQYLGVNNALRALENVHGQHGRLGVFWHTQGSGKSFSMVFFAQKVLRRVPGNWTFVIVTDRTELDDQIYRTFSLCNALGERCQADSADHLRKLLREDHRYVFTLIHKFRTQTGEVHPVLSERDNIIVMTDEAHRSQYDTLAMNMRKALPNAMFLAFTGTPLIAGEERTREVFGDYVSIYDFQQSIEDGATVPLYYENRTPELRLKNPELNDDIYAAIEAAELDADQEAKLERELGRQYHLITRDDRLDVVAKDVAEHFLGRGFQGKAMVVSIDKATALRMYDKVQRYWHGEIRHVESELSRRPYDDPGRSSLQERLKNLKTTDMALVVSPGQNEVAEMQKLGLDIVPHRKRMNEQSLDEKFKEPEDPLRLVFVCAMWLTGFDAPSCSTIYLDKPMRNHTLMQTVARANRVYPGKYNGLIVDYANVFASLEKALAIYGKGRAGEHPVEDKKQLIEGLRASVGDATEFCLRQSVNLEQIEATTNANFKRAQAVWDAAERLRAPETVRKDFLGLELMVARLYRAAKPSPAIAEMASRVGCLSQIALRIRNTGEQPDISAVMDRVQRVLDESIAADGFRIEDREQRKPLDLSKIDFEALQKEFKKSKRKNTDLERLKAAVRKELAILVGLNRTRSDYLSKFEELIDAYNSGSRNIDEIFRQLLALSRALTEEQSRHVRERLTEEQLTIFDVLTRPGPNLSTAERQEVKRVAQKLLERLNKLLVLGWRQKSQARARVQLAIEETLDSGLPTAYDKPLFAAKCTAVFEHVYESYQGDGHSIYAVGVTL
jgi:type I restriction enzyme, R subunit